jgi:hypothetical protein
VTLRQHAGANARSLFIARLAIIAYEAASAYVASRQPWRAAAVLGGLPFTVIRHWRAL